MFPSNEWALIGFLPVASQKIFKKTAGSEEKSTIVPKLNVVTYNGIIQNKRFNLSWVSTKIPRKNWSKKQFQLPNVSFIVGYNKLWLLWLFPPFSNAKVTKLKTGKFVSRSCGLSSTQSCTGKAKQVNLFGDLLLSFPVVMCQQSRITRNLSQNIWAPIGKSK